MREKASTISRTPAARPFSQHAFAIENPNGYRRLRRPHLGLPLRPADRWTLTIDGRKAHLLRYAARGRDGG